MASCLQNCILEICHSHENAGIQVTIETETDLSLVASTLTHTTGVPIVQGVKSYAYRIARSNKASHSARVLGRYIPTTKARTAFTSGRAASFSGVILREETKGHSPSTRRCMGWRWCRSVGRVLNMRMSVSVYVGRGRRSVKNCPRELVSWEHVFML